jgi:hypothetical protein
MSAAKRYHRQPQNSRLPRRARVSTVVMAALITAMLVALGQLAPGLWSTYWTPLARDPLSSFPHIILWAWERPEVLDFIDPDAVGVAFLAGTLSLSDEHVSVRPRLQPLSVPKDWVRAQDRVFQNCSGAKAVPDLAMPGSPRWCRRTEPIRSPPPTSMPETLTWRHECFATSPTTPPHLGDS